MDSARRRLLVLTGGVCLGFSGRPARSQARTIMTRKIPSTGEELPAVGLGTWQVFNVGASEAARAPLREVLAAFSKAGGKVVDSSPMYGAAELVAGDLIAGLGLREKLFIATKVWTSGREDG
ncbi:MAG TPA: aldo/keto reductase, partial [Burkholderiales bacterium]|nr:aldo/keto reductase [Burkholderiales bacterium]